MAKVMFDSLLRRNGYTAKERVRYGGVCVYEKKHTFNTITCYVSKDGHGKATDMTFRLSTSDEKWPNDFCGFKEASNDCLFLFKQAYSIYDEFKAASETKRGDFKETIWR